MKSDALEKPLTCLLKALVRLQEDRRNRARVAARPLQAGAGQFHAKGHARPPRVPVAPHLAATAHGHGDLCPPVHIVLARGSLPPGGIHNEEGSRGVWDRHVLPEGDRACRPRTSRIPPRCTGSRGLPAPRMPFFTVAAPTGQ